MRTTTLLTISVLVLAGACASQAAVFTTDFNSGLPAGTALYSNGVPPGPSVTATGGVGDSGVLRLTEAVGGQQCSFVIDDFNGGSPVNGFVARYKVRVGGGGGADGYSFCFGPDLPDGSWGEEGIGSGLIVAFDTYANAGEVPNTVEIKYGGASIAQTVFNFTTGNNFADVTITLCPNGRVSVVFGTQTVFDRVQVPYAPLVGRFGFGARTGGVTDNHWIDDLTIDTSDPAAVAITSQPTNQTVNEAQTATFTVGVDGICYNVAQWYRDGVAISGANNLSYSFGPVAPSDNGAVFRVEVTDNFGTVVSDNATLTVVPAPTLLGANSRRNPNGIFVFFSKDVTEASALNPANYTVNGGISVTGVVFNSFVATNGAQSVVMLQTTPALGGNQTYTVAVSNVQDGDGNTINPNPSSAGFRHIPGTICYDFNSGLPTGAAVYGSARVDSKDGVENTGALKINDALLSQGGAFRFDTNFANGMTLNKFRASFMVRIDNPQSGNPADGFSFNVASDLPAGTYNNPNGAEEGQGSGLTVSFDNFDSGSDTTPNFENTQGGAPAIDVKWSPYPVGGPVNVNNVPGGHRLMAKHNYAGYLPMVVELNADATVNVLLNGTNVFQNLPTPFQPVANPSFGIGGRTGGAFENNWFDDLCISLFNGGPINFPQPLANQTLKEARPFKLNLNVDGTPPYFIHWFSNDVEMVGATSEVLSGVATLDMDSARFYAVVSNEFSTATSATTTFTVEADNEPPVVLSAKANRGLNMIMLTFNEALDPGTATDPINVNVSGGLTITDRYLTNNGTTLVLITSPQTVGEAYEVTLIDVYDASIKNPINATVPVTSWAITPGFVQMELYKEIYGTSVSQLTSSSKFPNQPDANLYRHLTDWRQPQTGNPTRTQDEPWNRYGGRMSGLFTPQVSGTHRFYFQHDDEAQFRMSPDDNPANVATVVTATGVRNLPYADFTPQFADVTLNAGQRYYFEALFKEGAGGDYLSVGVREPGNNIGTNGIVPIQNYSLAAFADPTAAPSLTITQQPTDVSVESGHSGTFTVATAYTGNNIPFYQWYFSGLPVSGANGPTFVSPPGAFDEAVSVEVYLPGISVTSAPVMLHVVSDTTGPQITGSVVLTSNSVSIGFSEPITIDSPGTLTDPNNYRVNDSAIVASVTVMTPTSLQLTVSGTLSGTVTVRASTATKDSAGNAIVESGDLAGFSAAFTAVPVITWTDVSNSSGPPLPAGAVFTVNNRDFNVVAGGADVWSGGDQFTYIYGQRTGDFDVRVRIDRLDLAVGNNNLWSKAGLNIRETLDGTAANASRMVWVYPTPTNGAAQFEAAIRPEPGRDVIDVNGGSYGRWGRGTGSPWVRVKRVGKSFTYYNSFDGLNWNPIGLPRVANANPENGTGGLGLGIADAIDFADTLYVGLGVVSHNQNIITTADLAEFGDWSYPGASVSVTANPQDTVGYVGGVAKFRVDGRVSGAPQHELLVQWQRNGVDIPGAVSSYVDSYGYTTPPLTMDDDGVQYRAALIVPGAPRVYTTAATLSMLATNEPTPLQLVAARRDPTDANKVILTFNKLLRPGSAANIANYVIDQGVNVLSAQRQGTRKAVLTTSGLAPLSNCVSYAVSVNGLQDGNGTAIAPVSATIPANPAARVLFITGNLVGMNLADRVMIDRMDGMGYEVLPMSATTANRRGVSVANGMSLIFLSSQGGTTVGSLFRGLAVPTIVCRRDLADDYDMVPANAQTGTIASQTQINIVAAGHPLAAGLPNGNLIVVDTTQVGNRTFNWYSNPAPSAIIVARETVTTNNFRPVILAFEAGAAMLNGRTAASRRVAGYLEDNVAQFFNNNARALFDAMVNWVSMPAVLQQPQNLAITQGNSGTLCVVAGSLSSPTYQWYQDGVAISGATNERFVINNAQSGNAGNYTIVIGNASGGSITSAVATVSVTILPPGLTIARSGDITTLSWTNGGVLQEAPAITGPWINSINQANPQMVESYIVNMDGAQNGGGGRTGTGTGSLVLSDNKLTIDINYSGLSGNVTDAHIHGPAPRGSDAGVLYPLSPSPLGAQAGSISQTITLVEGTGGYTIAQQLQQLRSGLWYVNIHTTTFGSGEIRGQVERGGMRFFRVSQ